MHVINYKFIFLHMYIMCIVFQTAEKEELRTSYKNKLTLVIEQLQEDEQDLGTLYSMSHTLKNIATCSQEKLQSPEDIKTEVETFV